MKEKLNLITPLLR